MKRDLQPLPLHKVPATQSTGRGRGERASMEPILTFFFRITGQSHKLPLVPLIPPNYVDDSLLTHYITI